MRKSKRSESADGARGATSYPAIVGQVLRGVRELQGMTMYEMATAMGYENYIGWSRIETGNTCATAAQLRGAGRILGRSAASLLQDADALAEELIAQGVTVHEEKPRDGSPLLSGSAILAIVAMRGHPKSRT